MMRLVAALYNALEWLILNLFGTRLVALYRAAKFTYRLGLDVYSGVKESHVVLKTDVGDMPAKVFHPVNSNTKKPYPTIVVIHGLATSGYNDERVLQLCRAITGTGAVCVAPHIVGLTTCVISRDRVAEVTAAADAVAADPSLTVPGHRVSITSACITAGFALISSAKTSSINAVFCIGTHASARHVLSNCIEREGKGGALYAVESALLTGMGKDNPELGKLFHRSLEDDHLVIKDTPNEKLTEAIKAAGPAGKEYEDLMSEWEKVSVAIQKVYNDDVPMWDAVSPIHFVKDFKCKSVTLVHSASDGIVPPIESRLLHEAIKKLRKDVSAEVKITSLLDHGDKQTLGLSALPEAMSLVKLFSTFFRAAFAKQ